MKELTAVNKKQSVVTVGHNGLSFNVKTDDVLHRVAFVRVLLNAETSQLAVQAASVLSPQSNPLFRPEGFKSNRIKFNSRSMARQIREAAGWTEHDTWNIADVYSAKDDTTFYDLQRAVRPSGRGGCVAGQLTRRMIICGDFGALWYGGQRDKLQLELLEDLPFTIAFVDGNHENFTALSKYPVGEWNSGKVQFLRPHVIHLMRGQVSTLEGSTFFAMGGASSHSEEGILGPAASDYYERLFLLLGEDQRQYRIVGQSWWPEELPSKEEYAKAQAEPGHPQLGGRLHHHPQSARWHCEGLGRS